ncbi:hypothetical protein EIP91_001375 [Steccherinum ochraceum]|uniref:Uncharacterized protein n=1 Tax=Steccherinum ochraceum TaxID=92696 RepID=A0A4R0RMM1_9APHY|nr:hypothetical protein EIP91_001375 [Steccherinum ochraceum]
MFPSIVELELSNAWLAFSLQETSRAPKSLVHSRTRVSCLTYSPCPNEEEDAFIRSTAQALDLSNVSWLQLTPWWHARGLQKLVNPASRLKTFIISLEDFSVHDPEDLRALSLRSCAELEEIAFNAVLTAHACGVDVENFDFGLRNAVTMVESVPVGAPLAAVRLNIHVSITVLINRLVASLNAIDWGALNCVLPSLRHLSELEVMMHLPSAWDVSQVEDELRNVAARCTMLLQHSVSSSPTVHISWSVLS